MHLRNWLNLLLLFSCFYAAAQPGIKDSIYSENLKEQRRLQIQLPVEYKPGSAEQYPVLYLLDGEWNAELFQQVQAWSRQWGYTPPVIIVGVVNSYPNNQNQRVRDLTPTAGGLNGSGGGPKLLSFLKKELIPYINQKYPSSGSAILWGHSLGGLFVLYTLFTEPQLFDAYIAADPSVQWDHGFLLRYAKQKMSAVSKVKSLFITGRTGAAYHDMGIDSLELLLKSDAPANLQWKAVAYPDETHISQQYKSAYDGLKYTLAPLFQQDGIHIVPMGGILEKNKPFTLSCSNILPEKYMRFSTNGSEPTLSSPVLKAVNIINPVNNMRIKTFFAQDSADKILAVPFKITSPLAPRAKPVKAINGAWNYTSYSDSLMQHLLHKGKTGQDINLNQLNDSAAFYCRISGLLQTEKEGYYIFEMIGGPGTRLYLNDMLLVQTEGYNSFIVPLKKGFYSIRFEYGHQKGGADFDFGYRLPGKPGETSGGSISPANMYYLPE